MTSLHDVQKCLYLSEALGQVVVVGMKLLEQQIIFEAGLSSLLAAAAGLAFLCYRPNCASTSQTGVWNNKSLLCSGFACHLKNVLRLLPRLSAVH